MTPEEERRQASDALVYKEPLAARCGSDVVLMLRSCERPRSARP